MDYRSVKTAAIVGAGVAGLATAKTLKAIGVKCTVFERNDRVGGVWTDGYLGYGVQVQKELYEFPDFPLPKETPQFTPGPDLQRYLEDYVHHFGLVDLIKLSTRVTCIEEDEKAGWRVLFEDSDGKGAAAYDLVVICVGLYSNIPFIPEIEGRDRYAGEVLHIGDLKSADQLKDRDVAVIGYVKKRHRRRFTGPTAWALIAFDRPQAALASAAQACRYSAIQVGFVESDDGHRDTPLQVTQPPGERHAWSGPASRLALLAGCRAIADGPVRTVVYVRDTCEPGAG